MRDAANKTVFRACFLVRGVVPAASCVCAVRAACVWRCAVRRVVLPLPGALCCPVCSVPCRWLSCLPQLGGCAVRCRAFSPVSCGVSSGFRAARCGLRFAKARCRSVTVPRGNRDCAGCAAGPCRWLSSYVSHRKTLRKMSRPNWPSPWRSAPRNGLRGCPFIGGRMGGGLAGYRRARRIGGYVRDRPGCRGPVRRLGALAQGTPFAAWSEA